MKNFFYRVNFGDDLLSVCQKLNAPPLAIIKLNNLTCEIEEGDILEIISYPEKNKYTVMPFDSLNSIAKKLKTDIEIIKRDNCVSEVFFGLTLFV